MAKRTRDIRKLILDNIDIPEDDRQFLPRGFQRIGHVVILNLRPEASGLAERIAGLVLSEFSYVRTVCLSEGISGDLREPRTTFLAGDPVTETTHQENRCRFRLDPTRVMFSKGNLSERARVPRLVRSEETVVDLFAGIGYFSIPIAKLSQASTVYSIEKSPTAYRYLKENVSLNKVGSRVKPILGDCREVNLGRIADRVLMGYLPGTHEFLPAAFACLKPSGGIIHYHDNFHESELWDRPIEILESRAFRSGFSLKKVTHKAVVKEHSPRVYHAVVDAKFVKD